MPELLNQDQIAKILHLSTKTLERWRCTRTGPAWYKVGRNALYKLRDVEMWIEQQRVTQRTRR